MSKENQISSTKLPYEKQVDLDSFISDLTVMLGNTYPTGKPLKKAERKRIVDSAVTHVLRSTRRYTWIDEALTLWRSYFGLYFGGRKKVTVRVATQKESTGHLIQAAIARAVRVHAVNKSEPDATAVGNDFQVQKIHKSGRTIMEVLAKENGFQPFFFPKDPLAAALTGMSAATFSSTRYYLRNQGDDNGVWGFEKATNGWLCTPPEPKAVLPPEIAQKVKDMDEDTRQALLDLLSDI